MMQMDWRMASSQPPPPQPVARTAQTYPTIVLNRRIPSPLALQLVVAPPRLVIPYYLAEVAGTVITCGTWCIVTSAHSLKLGASHSNGWSFLLRWRLGKRF